MGGGGAAGEGAREPRRARQRRRVRRASLPRSLVHLPGAGAPLVERAPLLDVALLLERLADHAHVELRRKGGRAGHVQQAVGTVISKVGGYEVILRVAVKTAERSEAEKIRREIDPLAVNGMSATGKWATSAPGSRVRPVVGLSSCLVPRSLIHSTVSFY